jgi:hypothetical protein
MTNFRLEPWDERGLTLERRVNTAEMQSFLGGVQADNAASNAVCRKAGFEMLEEVDFEYPKGTPIRCYDWRYELR